jgi:uncharacterized protein (TIGR03435 family)
VTFCKLLVVIVIGGSMATGQIKPPDQFEVVSVKPTESTDRRALVEELPGRLIMRNFTARALVLFAYDVADYQVSGGPSWINSDAYDLQATTQGNATAGQMENSMLRALLQDRFRLSLHRETKQMPVYEMVLANRDGKLQPSTKDSCVVRSADAPPPPAAAPGTIFCGTHHLTSNELHRTLDGAGISMAALAGYLSYWLVHRPIINKTGLDGTFDIHMEWTADPPNGVGDPDFSGGPSIFTALREQLGLKLQSGTGPAEVLIIDHIEKPSPN